MKVTVKKVDALKRELKFEIPRERVSQKLEDVYKDLSRVAKVRGFRPGKVPRHILESEHGAYAKEETIKKLIPEVYQEGIVQEKIIPLDLPDIQDVQFKEGGLHFTATIDIKPEVKVENYKGLKVKRKSNQVTDEEIHKTLEYFQKSQGKEEGAPLDDVFARGLGYPNLADFKKSLARQMEIDKDRSNRIDVENQIVDALLKSSKLTVPQSLVKKQMERRVTDVKKRMASQGLSQDDIAKKEEDLRKDLQEPVERDVKVYLIFDKIAELESITVQENESLPAKVMELLMKEASWESE
jgi:FKBP-type peptidyl-prolyl cis-trans isomerase (trigger factor)